jgi:ComF family protein
MAQALQDQWEEPVDAIVWGPLSRKHLRKRGYDQAELLARVLGEELGMEPVSCLKKIRHTKPQSSIQGEAHRRANVFNVYQHQNADKLIGKRVLLVDDVVTTGSTAAECAKALMVGGADCVCFAALAATPDKKTRR